MQASGVVYQYIKPAVAILDGFHKRRHIIASGDVAAQSLDRWISVLELLERAVVSSTCDHPRAFGSEPLDKHPANSRATAGHHHDTFPPFADPVLEHWESPANAKGRDRCARVSSFRDHIATGHVVSYHLDC
jgi:hypothetical protein